MVNDMFGGELAFLDAASRARKENLPIISVSSSSFEDVKGALYLIEAIHKMKETKILNIGTSRESEDHSHWWRRDSTGYLKMLKDIFGAEVMTMGPERLNNCYEGVDERYAKEIAKKWTDEAIKVVEPGNKEILDAAKMYLSINELMEETKADAVTIDCLTLVYGKKIQAYPCLAYFQLNNDGSTGVCEADLNATVTQLLIRYLTDRPGFVSDPVIDTKNNQIIYAHCMAPTKIFGKNTPSAKYPVSPL